MFGGFVDDLFGSVLDELLYLVVGGFLGVVGGFGCYVLLVLVEYVLYGLVDFGFDFVG